MYVNPKVTAHRKDHHC